MVKTAKKKTKKGRSNITPEKPKRAHMLTVRMDERDWAVIDQLQEFRPMGVKSAAGITKLALESLLERMKKDE